MIEITGISQFGMERINAQYSGRDKKAYFSVEPRILPAGRKSTITVKSIDENMCLSGTMSVSVFPYYEYEYRPFVNQNMEIMELTVQDGMLSFEYEFLEEQMYLIIIGERTEQGFSLFLKTSVYALGEDLYGLMPLIGDFHSHTFYSDGFESPESVLRAAIRHGLDFIAITDHNNYEGSVVGRKVAESKNLPITVINGEEYTSTFTNMHIISLGAPAPLDEKYYWQTPNEDNQKLSVVEMTKELCRRIRENGGVSVMCHPLWKPLRRDFRRLDVPHSLVKELMESDIFDAIEVVGGSPIEDSMTSPMQHLWAMSYGATPDKTAYLGSTDAHTYTIDPICGKHFTMVFAENKTQEAIVDAVRQKKTVAVQILDDTNALVFGSPRYCIFAQFYLKEILQKIG